MGKRTGQNSIDRVRRLRPWLLMIGLAVLTVLVQTGCEQYGTLTPERIGDTLTVALPSEYAAGGTGGSVDLFFYRITSGKTGERLGVGDNFMIEERRQVRAVLQMDGLAPEEPMLIHFLWLNPDGKKMFTKDLYITAGDWSATELREELVKAHLKLDPTTGSLELESRYGVSPGKFDREVAKDEKDKKFKTGTWSVRVYLFRKLLMAGSFELNLDEDE